MDSQGRDNQQVINLQKSNRNQFDPDPGHSEKSGSATDTHPPEAALS